MNVTFSASCRAIEPRPKEYSSILPGWTRNRSFSYLFCAADFSLSALSKIDKIRFFRMQIYSWKIPILDEKMIITCQDEALFRFHPVYMHLLIQHGFFAPFQTWIRVYGMEEGLKYNWKQKMSSSILPQWIKLQFFILLVNSTLYNVIPVISVHTRWLSGKHRVRSYFWFWRITT